VEKNSKETKKKPIGLLLRARGGEWLQDVRTNPKDKKNGLKDLGEETRDTNGIFLETSERRNV